MGAIVTGRHSAAPDPERDRELALFLIGMRVNRVREARAWWPVVTAMPRMLRELQAHPELGLRHSSTYRSGRTLLLVQYWRDEAALEAYAKDPEHPHLPAWRAFNRAVRATDAVGIFHETYVVGASSSEAVYVDMPVMGLAAATAHVPVARRGQSAARRLDPSAPDEVVVPA